MKTRIWSMTLALSVALSASAVSAAAAQPTAADSTVTRGQFLTMLMQASGETGSADVKLPFRDAKSTDACYPAALWAYEKWIVNGDENSCLRPDSPITQQEAAAMLGRYLDYRYTALPDQKTAPTIENVAAWAKEAVVKCWMSGVVTDGTGTDFHPYEKVTQAQAAAWTENAQNITGSVNRRSPSADRSFADTLAAYQTSAENWTLSPTSIQVCLAMAANGAKGETQQELLSVLQISDLDDFNAQTQKRMERYAGYDRIMSMNMANSIWLNQSWFGGKGAFLPGFYQIMEKFYQAETREVTNNNSVEQVNQWVNEKTKGKIPTILTENNRDFVTALLNAVYFKAGWEQTFDTNQTGKQAFINEDGSQTQTDFMHKTGNYGYYSEPGLQAVQLNFRKDAADNEEGDNWEYFPDADFSMYFVLSDDPVDMEHLLDKAKFDRVKVKLTLPKFQMDYTAEKLDDVLKNLGVEKAYDAKEADFSGILDTSALPGKVFYLDTVLHKTFLSVDEKGVEAAAVTAAMNAGAAGPEQRPALVRSFTADHPFTFAIRDNSDGELLFVGRYANANKGQ